MKDENRVPVLGYTLDNEIRGGHEKYYVLKSNAFGSHSIDSLGKEDFL